MTAATSEKGHSRPLRIEMMGVVPYGPMLGLQQARHREVAAGLQDDTLFVLQHTPVVTLGRHAGATHLHVSPTELARRGIALHETGRGGDITYHGPGQLVAYWVMALQPNEQDLRAFVTALEEVILRVAADFGVDAHREPGLRGIWVGEGKLAAIGVRMARWVSLHGFALNLEESVRDGFNLMVPCGLQGRSVTTLRALSSQAAALTPTALMAKACASVLKHAGAVTHRRPYHAAPSPLPKTWQVDGGTPANVVGCGAAPHGAVDHEGKAGLSA